MKKAISPYSGNEDFTFVSYCHKDKTRVLPIIAKLMEKGCRIWYDDGIDPGTEWPEVIAEHLGSCAACVAFVSEASVMSHNCRREINFALMKQRPLLIVILDNVQLSPAMEMQFSTIQSVLAYRDETDVIASLLRFKPLLRCIGATPTDIIVPFLETSSEEKNPENVCEIPYLVRERSGAPVIFAKTLLVGRAENCGYPVVTNMNISGRHAELKIENGKLYISDLGSTNGTFVNNTRLEPRKSTELFCGDKVVLGDEVFFVKKGGEKAVCVECIRTGKTCFIAAGELSVGADKELCRFLIDDNKYVGKKHLTITVGEGRATVCDNNSTNGTWVLGERIPSGQPVNLNDGGVVRIANEYLYISNPNTKREM